MVMEMRTLVPIASAVLGVGVEDMRCVDLGGAYNFFLAGPFSRDCVVLDKQYGVAYDYAEAIKLGLVTLDEPIELNIETGAPV